MPGNLTLTLSLTHDCNLRCRYCYAERGYAHAMSRETAEKALTWRWPKRSTPTATWIFPFSAVSPCWNGPCSSTAAPTFSRRRKAAAPASASASPPMARSAPPAKKSPAQQPGFLKHSLRGYQRFPLLPKSFAMVEKLKVLPILKPPMLLLRRTPRWLTEARPTPL